MKKKIVSEIILCFVFFLGARLIFYYFDHEVHYYFGDSLEYLNTAISGFIPNDRSWIYGKVIAFLCNGLGTLQTLIVAQIIFNCLIISILQICIYLFTNLRRAWRISICILFAIEPSMLLLERMVLAETFGLFFAALFILCALSYLEGKFAGRWELLLAAHFFGVLALALRSPFSPMSLLIGGALPLVLWFFYPHVRKKMSVQVLLITFIFSTFTLITFRSLYAHNYAHRLQEYYKNQKYYRYMRPTLQYNSGWFLFFSCINNFKPKWSANEFFKKEVEAAFKKSYGDEFQRATHNFFHGDGIRARCNQNFGEKRANKIAGKSALKAYIHEPFIFIKNIIKVYREPIKGFGNEYYIRRGLVNDLLAGKLFEPYMDGLANKIEAKYNLPDIKTAAREVTPARAYFLKFACEFNLLIIIASLLAILLYCFNAIRRFRLRGTSTVAMASMCGYICVMSFYSSCDYLRVYQPMNFFAPLALALCVSELRKRVKT